MVIKIISKLVSLFPRFLKNDINLYLGFDFMVMVIAMEPQNGMLETACEKGML